MGESAESIDVSHTHGLSHPGGRGGPGGGLAMRRAGAPADCGIQLPLLSPRLSGLRLRTGQRGLEFLLPNPSGGRGVYVASWTGVASFAPPCLHDTMLVGRLSALDRIDPAGVREAALRVARDGHAGTEAARAAAAVDTAQRTGSLRLGATLLLSVARRAGLGAPGAAARCLEPDGFQRLAARLGWDAPGLALCLRAFSAHHATVATGGEPGRPEAGATGRWGRLARLVRRLRAALAAELGRSHGADGAMLGRIIAAADRCLEDAAPLLTEIDRMRADPLPLLLDWRDRGQEAAVWLRRLETVFDGWDRACLLWFDDDTPRRRQAAINELAVLTGTPGHGEGAIAADAPDAGSDRGHALLTRNRRLRARELRLDAGAA